MIELNHISCDDVISPLSDLILTLSIVINDHQVTPNLSSQKQIRHDDTQCSEHILR